MPANSDFRQLIPAGQFQQAEVGGLLNFQFLIQSDQPGRDLGKARPDFLPSTLQHFCSAQDTVDGSQGRAGEIGFARLANDLIGTNFKRLRLELGLTQEQVAERSGFSQQYISGLEAGRRNPTVVTVWELANSLGVTALDLLRP